jgi:hypothetical protein
VIGGISSYKAAKARGARGWKLVGKTALGVAGGAIGGGTLKLLKGGYRIVKVGRLKGYNDRKGYWGVKYSKPRAKSKNRITRSLELHTPHNNHGWHIQKNRWSKNKGKWKRGKADWRKTIKKSKKWK